MQCSILPYTGGGEDLRGMTDIMSTWQKVLTTRRGSQLSHEWNIFVKKRTFFPKRVWNGDEYCLKLTWMTYTTFHLYLLWWTLWGSIHTPHRMSMSNLNPAWSKFTDTIGRYFSLNYFVYFGNLFSYSSVLPNIINIIINKTLYTRKWKEPLKDIKYTSQR